MTTPGSTGIRTTVLDGYVEVAEHRQALREFFKYLRLNVDDSRIELLPSPQLGEKRFAIVRVSNASLYARPAEPAESVTQCLKGDGIYLLKDFGNRILCHNATGYVGFIAAADIERLDTRRFDDARSASSASTQPSPAIERAIESAKTYLGTKYLWGGLTREGIDCSGLVHTAFASQGIHLPRDADQQSLVGTLVATRWHRTALRRGDLLYFLGRRGTISHTAIYLGNEQFIEATDPVVAVNSFNPKDKNYSPRRDQSFCFAKRLID